MASVYYTPEEHDTWRHYLEKHKNIACAVCVPIYSSGLEKLAFDECRIPEISSVSACIERESGYELTLVDKLVPPKNFFHLLSQGKFPISISIRPKEQVDFYTSENPDLIHDFFGHCPFLVDGEYAEYLRKISHYSCNKIEACPEAEGFLQRLYWHTIEFGLVRTDSGVKAYGAGILPSRTEIECALYETPGNREFDLAEVLLSDFNVTDTQDKYYVLNEMNSLFKLDMDELEELIEMYIADYRMSKP